MIKTFEKFNDKNYLNDVKTYCLLKTTQFNEFIVAENKKMSFKVINYIINDEILNDRFFYFMLEQDVFNDRIIYQSDTLQEIYDNINVLLDTKKYNL